MFKKWKEINFTIYAMDQQYVISPIFMMEFYIHTLGLWVKNRHIFYKITVNVIVLYNKINKIKGNGKRH